MHPDMGSTDPDSSDKHSHTERDETMADPRNIAHDEKVQEVKKHHHVEAVPAALATPQPGRKPPLEPEDIEVEGRETFHQHQQHVDPPTEE
jgi:hypothetical protein